MATSPAAFFRFLAENTDVILALFERGEVDEAELLALITRARAEGQAAPEHVRRQFEELGIVEHAAHADASLELSQPVFEVLAWLTRRQRLSSAVVLQAYLDELDAVGRDLDEAIRKGDASAAVLALKDADGLVEKVRVLSEGNRESIVTEAQALRSSTTDTSAVDRFQVVRRLWEKYLEPLRGLVAVQGEMERRLDRLRALLDEGEQRFLAHGALQRPFSRTAARLVRMRRTAADAHHAAVVEVAPLYDRLRRESRWALGASRALAMVRSGGAATLDLDRRLGLTGWRTRYLISDDHLRARFAGLIGYVPDEGAVLGDAPPPPRVPLITREELRHALELAAPIEDVLAFVLSRWPDHPLTAQLRAYGLVVGGVFGPVTVPSDATERTYSIRGGRLGAWPLTLAEIVP